MAQQVRVENLTKEYNDIQAVKDLSFTIKENEFFTLLGPSGCGKTTTLRCIAGLETPTQGEIYVGENDITGDPIHKRGVGMVFQNYALFPHLTVKGNVAFGLKMKGDNADIDNRVARALERVQLSDEADSAIDELSGGQQQRVALARAIVIEPAILLSDEPLGALDLKLRQELQIEMMELQEDLGMTMLHVTHDQQEALTMSDRIGVMRDGKLVQVGEPDELYENPRNSFISNFLGRSNVLLTDIIHMTEATLTLEVNNMQFKVNSRAHVTNSSEKQPISIRPEQIQIFGKKRDNNVIQLEGEVTELVYLGSDTLYTVGGLANSDSQDVGATVDELLIQEQGAHSHEIGDKIALSWDADAPKILED